MDQFIRTQLNRENLKKSISKLLNLLCIFVLVYNAIDMTLVYLKFNYKYKMSIDYKKGIDLPAINLCTESQVMFDKSKVIQYFDIENVWNKYRSDAYNHYESHFDPYRSLKDFCEFPPLGEYREYPSSDDSWKWRVNYCVNRFLKPFDMFIKNEANFYETNSLIINGNDLFNCTLDMHSNDTTPISSNITRSNCGSNKRIYANKEFGVCYQFFDENQKIFIENENVFIVNLKFEEQKKIYDS